MLHAFSPVYILSTGEQLPKFRRNEVSPLGFRDPEEGDNKHFPK